MVSGRVRAHSACVHPVGQASADWVSLAEGHHPIQPGPGQQPKESGCLAWAGGLKWSEKREQRPIIVFRYLTGFCRDGTILDVGPRH